MANDEPHPLHHHYRVTCDDRGRYTLMMKRTTASVERAATIAGDDALGEALSGNPDPLAFYRAVARFLGEQGRPAHGNPYAPYVMPFHYEDAADDDAAASEASR